MHIQTWALRLTVAAFAAQAGLLALMRLAPDLTTRTTWLSTIAVLLGVSQVLLVAALVLLGIWTFRLRRHRTTIRVVDVKWLTVGLLLFVLAAFLTKQVGSDLQRAMAAASAAATELPSSDRE